jgi:hypothetical protein
MRNETSKWSRLYRLYFDDDHPFGLRFSGGSGICRPTTKGHVKYSGKAVHRLEQNEGLSPPVMFRPNLVVFSTRRHNRYLTVTCVRRSIRHHLNALINASNCVRIDLSCGVTAGILRSIPSNS